VLRLIGMSITARRCHYGAPMGKKVIELLLCLLHPIAVVLIWYQLAFKRDDWAFTRMAWAVAVVFPLVPFVYVLTGNDFI
jgi:hypothetical protein